MSLLSYEKRLSNLRLNSARGNKSPHKVAMLLGVVDLIASGEILDNRIYFDERLKQEFTKHFDLLASDTDRNNPHLPFFHLRSEGFWHHKIRPGRQSSYSRLTTITTQELLVDQIEYAFLDDELFELLGSQVARNLLSSAMQNNLDDKTIRELLKSERGGWDWLECEFLVNDYVAMLEKHICGHRYNKSEHRRALQPHLNQRSEGSIEYKYQNVSAVLLELGLPYIPGYKPAFNYQQLLKQVVVSYLAGHQQVLEDVSTTADTERPASPSAVLTFDQIIDPEPPEIIPRIAEERPSYIARRIDYSERERRNRYLGQCAESFIVGLEQNRLRLEGRPDLADEVEWSSRERGDGLGFDIRSFDVRCEKELFLEVKATQSGKYQPFFMSENERAFSNEYSSAYRLYRLYKFGPAPRLFILPGAIEQHVTLAAQSYKAQFSSKVN